MDNSTLYQQEANSSQFNILFNQERLERLNLQAENISLREQLAERDERIADLEAQLDAEKSRSTSIYMRYESVLEWTRKLFANASIPLACKLVIWQVFLTISSRYSKPVGQEAKISMEEVADELGIGKDTARRALDKMQTFDILARRYEKIDAPDGTPRKLVHITLNDIVASPNQIRMEKLQGGKREHVCKYDGEKLDNYTVRHCATHGEVTIYGQIDLRADADHSLMIKDFIRQYRDMIPDALNDQKQDAFGDEQTPFVNSTPQKQDAFGVPAQLATEHTNITTAASCSESESSQKQDAFGDKSNWTMDTSNPVCRFCDEISQWIWSPVDNARICPSCYSLESVANKRYSEASV